MIRLIQRRLIIPRGDTGAFNVPYLKTINDGDVAVFTIFDCLTRSKMYQKVIAAEGDVLNITFSHNDTVNLKPGKYLWDIKFYTNPQFLDDELVNGDEIDSYYAGYTLPVCEIRETGDDYLASDDAPTGNLSPEQLDIITAAINALNDAIDKTNTNVEHYPQIRDEVWYIWDAQLGDYVSTGVRANGIVGNGIASAVLNNDYTLTLNFTDGTSFTSPSIRGETGNGIDDIVLNNDFTLTITYTDGESYTTPSIRGPIGVTPQFSIGEVQDGAVAAASITGTAENPVLNLTLPNANVPTKVSELENDAGYLTEHQDLSDYVKNTDYATSTTAGIVKVAGLGVKMSDDEIVLAPASNGQMKRGSGDTAPIVAAQQHQSTFYGLAKAAGDTTQSQSANAVGAYTDEAKTAIRTMLDVPSNADVAAKQDTLTFDSAPIANSTNPVTSGGVYSAIANVNTMKIHICAQAEYDAETGIPTIQNPDTQTFYLVPGGEGNNLFIEWAYVNGAWERFGSADVEVPVQDVQINGVSVLSDGVANVPRGDNSTMGVVRAGGQSFGITAYNGILAISAAPTTQIKAGTAAYLPINAARQHESTFYGLAKAAGADMKDIANTTVGVYPDAQKEAIQSMLGITQMLAPTNPNLVASQAYAIGDVFAANGHLYKATAAIAQDGAIIPDTNCVETTMVDAGGKIKDVQVNGTTIVNNGVANVPAATRDNYGTVKIYAGYGIKMVDSGNYEGSLRINPAQSNVIKIGNDPDYPITPVRQHESVFYGLAKAAGADEKDSTLPVGQYTANAKAAIRSMIGAENGDDIVKVQDTEPTSAATKIWLPETPPASVTVPTVAEMEQALAGKANLSDISDIPVEDVQMNGISVVSDGIAEIPRLGASGSGDYGVCRVNQSFGVTQNGDSGYLILSQINDVIVKAGDNQYIALTPRYQHKAVFYGLAKAAGDTTMTSSSNAVGTYTDNAKASIKSMLGIVDGSTGTVDVSGTTPTIAAVENTRYVCGEVTSLNFTPAASGICIVRFTSGSTVTVLTLPSTVKFPEWFDSTSLETNTIYEICITDGIYGAVMSWAL